MDLRQLTPTAVAWDANRGLPVILDDSAGGGELDGEADHSFAGAPAGPNAKHHSSPDTPFVEIGVGPSVGCGYVFTVIP